MSGPLFDVFVVGAADGTPAGQARLAETLAGRHRVPVAVVAKAIADKALRAGQALDQARAQALVRELQSLGAATVIRPAAAAGPATAVAAAPPTVASPAPTVASGPPTGLGGVRLPPPRPGAAGLPGADPVGFDPFASGVQLAPTPTMAAAAAPGRTAAAGPPAARDPFAPPDEGSPMALELKTEESSSDQLRKLSDSVAGAAGIVVRAEAGSSESGLALGPDTSQEVFSIRCPRHGLFYDRRKASGCRKCLEPGRQIAGAMADKARGGRLGDFRDNPTRRAFVGLGVALGVGLIPAAYYALRVGAGTARRLREEQEMLSRRAGTEEVVRQFEEIDRAVGQTRQRSMRNTAGIWASVTAAALALWYRIT